MTEPRLLDMTRDALRRKHYSLRTEESYLRWIRQYILFNDKRHPKEMGAPELEAFLTHLAIHRKVSASMVRLRVTTGPESGGKRDPIPLPARASQ